jgi:hypothetical protein
MYSEVAIAKNRRPDRLLRTYRLSLLEFKELEFLAEAMEGKPISLANELKSYRGIISGLQSLLQSYATTEAVCTTHTHTHSLSLSLLSTERFATRRTDRSAGTCRRTPSCCKTPRSLSTSATPFCCASPRRRLSRTTSWSWPSCGRTFCSRAPCHWAFLCVKCTCSIRLFPSHSSNSHSQVSVSLLH